MTTMAARPVPVRPPLEPADRIPAPHGGARSTRIAMADPATQDALVERNGAMVAVSDGRTVAPIIGGIPRFVPVKELRGGYASTFGWQWKKWSQTLSDVANNNGHKRRLILDRTHFNSPQYDLTGRTLLECGCGSGNDTEVLLSLPLAEVHSFDLSPAVEEARQLGEQAAAAGGPKLVLSQASITEIPYPDRSFDVVYCHRVLQHTPNPEASLRSICRKVKPGGILFIHSYHKNPLMDRHWRHKYRWLCKRLPPRVVTGLLTVIAPLLRPINRWLRDGGGKPHGPGTWRYAISHGWIPLQYTGDAFKNLGRGKQLEIEKLIAFDAVTAWHDHPMTREQFVGIIESEGFTIDHLQDAHGEPLCATARLTSAK